MEEEKAVVDLMVNFPGLPDCSVVDLMKFHGSVGCSVVEMVDLLDLGKRKTPNCMILAGADTVAAVMEAAVKEAAVMEAAVMEDFPPHLDL